MPASWRRWRRSAASRAGIFSNRRRGAGAEPRPAADIRVGKVVRDMEPDLALVECFHGEDRCAITPYCELRVVFEQGLRRFLETLDGYTLEDMVRGERRQLIRILEPPSFG